MSAHLERAQLLMIQSRHEMAEQELRLALAEDPDDAMSHAMLAKCLAEREAYTEAIQEAELAIHLAPEESVSHHVLAGIQFERHRLREATAAIDEALRLDPYDASNHGMKAWISIGSRRWSDALDAAREGLSLDPDDSNCANAEAVALVKLGRTAEAGETINAALERDPEDADTHANRGWQLLEERNHEEALGHFREALRLEPDSEWARQGVVTALKSRYIVYRLMLAYFLWMAKLPRGTQWMITLGAFGAQMVAIRYAKANPDWAPWLWPFILGIALFGILTWLANPCFNLLLRLSRLGRIALSREQIVTSTWVGLFLFAALAFAVEYLVFGVQPALFAGIACVFLTMFVSNIHDCDSGWPRNWMIGLFALVMFLALGALLPGFLVPFLPPLPALLLLLLGYVCRTAFWIAAIGTEMAGAYLSSVTPRK